jgi:ssDNA-binding Zn-finger/Zn-ribbon topoisomerase 1
MATCMDDRCCICGETRQQHIERRPQWTCAHGGARFVAAPRCPRCDSAAEVDTVSHPAFFRNGTSTHMCHNCGIGFLVDAKGRSLAV